MNKFIVALALCAGWPAAPHAEPLTTPARMSARAHLALLVALAPAGKRIVAAGERGIVVYSDDGGARWEQAAVPVSVNLTALHFADARHGWAAGHDGVVLSTADGGKHWSTQLDGNALNAMLLAEAQKRQARAHDAALADPTGKAARGALAAAGNALADVEAGMKFGPSRPLLGIWFKDASEGYAVGAFGLALRSDDGGAHWENIGVNMDNPDGLHLNAIGPGPDGALLAAGEGGRVYRSRDGGRRWETLNTGYQGQLYGVHAIGADGLLAYGFGGKLLRSGDGGKSWQGLPQLTRKSLVGAGRAPDGALLVAASDGAILRSVDHGRSFALAEPARGLALAAVLLDGAALAVGVGGVHHIGATGAAK